MKQRNSNTQVSSLGGMSVNDVSRYGYLSFIEFEGEPAVTVDLEFEFKDITVMRGGHHSILKTSDINVTAAVYRMIMDDDDSVVYIIAMRFSYLNSELDVITPPIAARSEMVFTGEELLDIWGSYEEIELKDNIEEIIRTVILSRNTHNLDRESGLIMSAKCRGKLDRLIGKVHQEDMAAFNVTVLNEK